MIERTFGVLKRRFLILQTAPEYPYDVQVKLVFALTALHNFIRKIGLEDIHNFEEEERELEQEPVIHSPQALREEQIEEWDDENMASIRDNIAESMWVDYQAYLNRRRGG